METTERVKGRFGSIYFLFCILMILAVLLAVSSALARPGVLGYLTVRGTLTFAMECAWREHLLDVAAFTGNSRAIDALKQSPSPTIWLFAREHPGLVRPGVNLGELEQREAAQLPPPVPVVPVASK